MSSIWKYVKRIALGLAVVILLLLIWGVGIEPRLVDYKAETAVIPNLPPAWEGKRVALIADFQIGMWLGNEGTVKEIVNRIVAERPAAVFVAGDFVYKPTDEDEPDDVEREDVANFMPEVNEAAALLRPLVEAGIPTYVVLGNHDYGMNYPDSVKNERLAIAVRETLEANGARVVDNAAAALSPPAENNAPNDSTANAETPNLRAETQNLYVVGIGSS